MENDTLLIFLAIANVIAAFSAAFAAGESVKVSKEVLKNEDLPQIFFVNFDSIPFKYSENENFTLHFENRGRGTALDTRLFINNRKLFDGFDFPINIDAEWDIPCSDFTFNNKKNIFGRFEYRDIYGRVIITRFIIKKEKSCYSLDRSTIRIEVHNGKFSFSYWLSWARHYNIF